MDWKLQTDNKLGDITKELWEKVIQFHGTFHGLKITNWSQLRLKQRESWFIQKTWVSMCIAHCPGAHMKRDNNKRKEKRKVEGKGREI